MAPNHSFLGPSSAERWFNCPGSINLIETLPPEAFRKNKYGAEGTVAHKLAEEYITGKISLPLFLTKVGDILAYDGFEVEVIEDMVNGAVEYENAIEEAKKWLTKPIEIVDLTEVKVQAKTIDERVWGTADKIIFQKGHVLIVIDYKFGKTVVEAEDNKQMLVYAVAAEDSVAGVVFDKVILGIVQPRAKHSEGTVRWVEFSPAEIRGFRKVLKAAVEATKNPQAPRIVGAWCKFCPAFAYCPEARNGVEAAAQTTFTKLPAPPSKEVGVTFLPDAERFTPEQLAKALEWEDSIDSWYEAVRARALAELQKDPMSVPGFKLVEKKTNRVWEDEIEVKGAFTLLGDKIYAPRKLLSPAQMEKVAGKEEVARWAIKPVGEPTVVKSSDKREALTPQIRADEVFDAIGSEKDALFGDMLAAKEKPFWP